MNEYDEYDDYDNANIYNSMIEEEEESNREVIEQLKRLGRRHGITTLEMKLSVQRSNYKNQRATGHPQSVLDSVTTLIDNLTTAIKELREEGAKL